MKSKSLFIAVLLAVSLAGFVDATEPVQQGVGRGPISAPLDLELERQSLHSLEVARYYFYRRKPAKNDKAGLERLNKAVESRLLEIIDLNPRFGKTDEVFFLLGEVYLRGDNDDEAARYFNRLIKEFPDSQFVVDARRRVGEVDARAKGKKQG
jgi:outer membrane protein assembly factor BamD (BamD/ComL family)